MVWQTNMTMAVWRAMSEEDKTRWIRERQADATKRMDAALKASALEVRATALKAVAETGPVKAFGLTSGEFNALSEQEQVDWVAEWKRLSTSKRTLVRVNDADALIDKSITSLDAGRAQPQLLLPYKPSAAHRADDANVQPIHRQVLLATELLAMLEVSKDAREITKVVLTIELDKPPLLEFTYGQQDTQPIYEKHASVHDAMGRAFSGGLVSKW